MSDSGFELMSESCVNTLSACEQLQMPLYSIYCTCAVVHTLAMHKQGCNDQPGH